MQVPYGLVYLTSLVVQGSVKRRYIGQHKLRGGIIEDGYLGSGKLLLAAIKKYGRDAFAREVLEVCYSFKELMQAEIKWIEYYNAVESDDFYNIIGGGQQGFQTRKTAVHKYGKDGAYIESFTTINKASLSLGSKGQKISRGSITKCCSDNKDCLTRKLAGGFQWSYEKNLEGIEPISKYRGNSKPVQSICIDTKEIAQDFPSLNEAAETFGVNPSIIHKAIKGGGTSCGFLWKFKSKDLKLKSSEKPLRGVQQLDKSSLEVINDFVSIKEASIFIGVSVTAIHHAITRSGTSAGYCWKFTDCSFGKAVPKSIKRAVNMLDPETKRLIKTYTHVVQAADELGGNGNSIHYAIRNGYKSRGHYWEYAT